MGGHNSSVAADGPVLPPVLQAGIWRNPRHRGLSAMHISESTSAGPVLPRTRARPRRAWTTPVGPGRRPADEGPLRDWLAAELDYDGSPRRLAVEGWGPCVDRMAEAARARAGWSSWVRTRAGGLFQWRVHASRPDGSHIFGPAGKDPARVRALVGAAALATEPGLASVLARWFPADITTRRRAAPVPSAAISDNDRVLAVIRPDWDARGAWVALDHRAGEAARFELATDGRPWLLGPWRPDGMPGPDSPPRPTRWESEPDAEVLEWSFRAGPLKVRRTAVVLREPGIILVAQQEDGPVPWPTSTLRLPLADGVSAAPAGDVRALALSRARSSVRLIPLGLPALPYATERGSFAVIEGREAVLRQPSAGRRRWLPLIVAWGRPHPSGMADTLTVTGESRRSARPRPPSPPASPGAPAARGCSSTGASAAPRSGPSSATRPAPASSSAGSRRRGTSSRCLRSIEPAHTGPGNSLPCALCRRSSAKAESTRQYAKGKIGRQFPGTRIISSRRPPRPARGAGASRAGSRSRRRGGGGTTRRGCRRSAGCRSGRRPR